MKGSIREIDVSNNAFAIETQLPLHRKYYKSYMDPKNNEYEAAVIIFEIASETDLLSNIEACIAYIKKKEWLSAIRVGRFLVCFFSLDEGWHEGKNRKIFENFYLPKDGQIVYQRPSREEIY